MIATLIMQPTKKLMKPDQNSGVKMPLEKEKTDAITEKARKLTAGFNAEGKADNTLTRAEVVKMTPRARLEFFRHGGKFKDA